MKRDFWKDRSVLITGHEGFLGSWLTNLLVEKECKVVGIDIVRKKNHPTLKGVSGKIKSIKGDIANKNLVEKIVKSYKPAVIFHLAAEAIVERANKNPLRTFKSNIEGTWNVLEVAKTHSFINAVVVASSDKAYGTHNKLPYKEDAALKGEHPYDVSKSCADLLCQTYYNVYKTPVCITRCGNIYGPGDLNFSRLVPDALRHIIKNEQFLIRSDGTFTRDYIFVRDVAEAYMLLAERMIEKGVMGEAFNFSCEKPLSVLGLYEKLVECSEKKTKSPKILNQAKHEIKHQYLSAKKARTVLGWKPRYTLTEGLRETYNWYKEYCK